MKIIKLTNGMDCLVDDCDFERLSKIKWRHYRNKQNNTYAIWNSKRNQKAYRIIMHRLVIDVPDGFMVDHIDGNGLNNQRSNLRVATNSQNQMNTKPRGKSKYKGVYFYRPTNKWAAQICIKGHVKNLGRFDCEIEAAKAFDAAARADVDTLNFRRLNFPD